MIAATPVEKKSSIQQAEKKKKKRQAEPLPLLVPGIEHANLQTQKLDAPKAGTSTESSNKLSGHNVIPAVHGSQPAYAQGSELMHVELQASLQKTGDLNHPDTQKKEMDYKMTLGVNELRDYHDIKSGNNTVKPIQSIQEQVSKKEVAKNKSEVKKESTSIVADVSESIEITNDTQTLTESSSEQLPIKPTQDISLVNEAKKEKIMLQNPPAKIAQPKAIKANKEVKIVSNGNPGDLLANLSLSPATKLADNFNPIQTESTGVLNNQNKETASQLPKIDASQGSAFNKAKTKNNLNSGKTIAKTSKKTVKSVSTKPAIKEIPFPEKTPLKKVNYSFVGSKSVAVEKKAQSQLDAINLNTAAIPTKMQESAKLDLSGEADTDHLSIERDDASQDMSIKKNLASNDIHKDYGENDIIKEPTKEILKTKNKLQTRNVKINPVKAFKLEGIEEAGINSNFEPIIQEKIGAESGKYETAQLEHDKKVLEEENTAETKIEIEKNNSKDKQLKSVKDAHSDVNKSRADWQKELDKTETDFAKKAGDQAKTTIGNISKEKTAGEKTAQGHINKANDDAYKEKERADKEANEKKSEKKKESGGFFGWVADKASAFINALKDALNFIFTKLREAVKAIFDFAKKLVLAALELARKAIVSFIKGFAVLLKGFLDIALAAFPVLRDRIKAKIDHYVTVAEKYVNQAFDLFKKAVTAIIDFLASAVDALLGVLQAFYNLILDAINFIVAGIIKIIEFIFNLNVAAAMSVFEFFGALAEEALGGNPANPLQDIEVPMGQEKSWAAAMGLQTETQVAQEGKESINTAIPVLTKPKLDDGDVVLEPYPAVTMDQDSMRSLPNLKDGEKFELGGAGENSVTTQQFQESAAFDAGYSIHNEEQNLEQKPNAADAANQMQKEPDPDWRHWDDERKLQYYNEQMLTESAQTGNAEPTKEKATPEATVDNSPEALITKTGRLGVGRRLEFMGEQMLTGIKAFWNKYKGWIITGLVVALVAVAAILFFSGGTALGLVVEAIGEALTLIFGAYAVFRAMGMIWEYVKKAWAGDKQGAAKALATAFAIIVVEFFIDKIMAGMGKVYKRMLKAFKATKVGRFVRKVVAIVKTVQRKVGNLIKKGISKLRGTKLVVFLEKIAVKGANKLDDLRNKILTKFGFKKIWFEKHGRYIELWGDFNPKVLLMREDGEHELHDIPKDKISTHKGETFAEINGQKVKVEKVNNKQIITNETLDPNTGLTSRKNTVVRKDGSTVEVTTINKHGVNEDLLPIFPSGRMASNAQEFAGKNFKLSPELAAKYGEDVPFTKDGFPDFEEVMNRKGLEIKEVEIQMSGDSPTDIRAANKEAFGKSATDKKVQIGFEDYTWHHHHDQKRMILIPTDLHNAARHYGGDALTRAKLGLEEI